MTLIIKNHFYNNEGHRFIMIKIGISVLIPAVRLILSSGEWSPPPLGMSRVRILLPAVYFSHLRIREEQYVKPADC